MPTHNTRAFQSLLYCNSLHKDYLVFIQLAGEGLVIIEIPPILDYFEIPPRLDSFEIPPKLDSFEILPRLDSFENPSRLDFFSFLIDAERVGMIINTPSVGEGTYTGPQEASEVDNENKKVTSEEAMTYIGESARTLRQRAGEHWDKVRQWGVNSFIIRHWMMHHGTSIEPSRFRFKVIKSFSEPMGRQILEALLILEKGTLNLKLEFGANHLCRLQAAKSDWEAERERIVSDRMKKKIDDDVKQFIYVMSKVKSSNLRSNESTSCRSKTSDRKGAHQQTPGQQTREREGE